MLPLGRNKVLGLIRPAGLVFATCDVGGSELLPAFRGGTPRHFCGCVCVYLYGPGPAGGHPAGSTPDFLGLTLLPWPRPVSLWFQGEDLDFWLSTTPPPAAAAAPAPPTVRPWRVHCANPTRSSAGRVRFVALAELPSQGVQGYPSRYCPPLPFPSITHRTLLASEAPMMDLHAGEPGLGRLP